jgi:hypothetical protein
MADRQQVFVAYPAGDKTLSDGILDAVRKANAVRLPIIYEPWEFNDVAGNPLVSPILEKIDEAPFIIADITYLNLNVVYEIGFTIGKSKRAFLIRHGGIAGDKAKAASVGIFDTIGYFEYENFAALEARLKAHIEAIPIPFTVTVDRKSAAYLIEPPSRGTDIGIMVSAIKKAGYGRYRSFTPNEDSRLPGPEAIRNVAASAGVFIPLQENNETHNIRCMFVAGLGDGMEKPKLLLAPTNYRAPLDVRDDVQAWHQPSEMQTLVGDFCPRMVEYEGQLEPSKIDRTSLLQSLSIGDPRAENEMATLDRYYLKIDQFDRAVNGEVNLVVGRKGAGKTALFIRLRDKIRADRRNIVVDLKPEGYQLIKLKEDILAFLAEGARQHLIVAFWEYLIYLEIAYKLLEKDQKSYRYNRDIHDAYVELSGVYSEKHFSAEGDFSERLNSLAERLSEIYKEKYGDTRERRLTAAEVTELVYTRDIKRLRELISSYLQRKESVWVMFDNLDHGWGTQGVDVIDAAILRGLVDAGRKIEREMRKAGNIVHCMVFVRNDVYDHLMRNSPDYGKEMRATLDWDDPDMLREMLRLRLVCGMDGDLDKVSFNEVWHVLCVSHYRGEASASYLIDRTLMRPRNLLKLFNHCRGFATNFSRDVIAEPDIEKGVKAYSADLLEELDRELNNVFPAAGDLLYHFLDASSELQHSDLEKIYKDAHIAPEDYQKVTDFLLYYGVLGIKSDLAVR